MGRLLGSVAILAVAIGSAHAADVNLWIDDTAGNIGLVDITTGTVSQVNNTGQALTDIAFVGNQMFGTTFTNLVSINDSTGASTPIAQWGTGNNGMNALLGNGTGLLAASGTTKEVYNATTLGATTNFKTVPLPSAGDLALNGKTLYESAVNTDGFDALVNVTTGTVISEFNNGAQRFSATFGLATDSAGTTYAVDGTQIYSVDLSNGALNPVFNYSGHGLGAANGTAFIQESVGSVPEPSTWAMMFFGFGGLALLGARRARTLVSA
jgi:hypothetical protein